MTSPSVTTLVVFFATLLASKQVPFEKPGILDGARKFYLCIQLLVLSVHLYVLSQIRRKRDTTILKIDKKPNTPMTTTYAYDIQEWRAVIKGQLLGLVMLAVMHLYFKMPHPLILQSVLPLKSLMQSRLFQIHVLGRPAVGELKRPWKTGPGLLGLLVYGRHSKVEEKSD